MRKESTGVLLAVLITAALLGGTYYIAVVRPAADAGPAETTWIPLEPVSPAAPPARSPQTPSSQPSRGEGVGSAGTRSVPAGTPPSRTDRIIQCHDPEIGTFFTNAATCEDADPYKRISIAEPVHTTPGQDRYSGQDYTPPEQAAGNSRVD